MKHKSAIVVSGIFAVLTAPTFAQDIDPSLAEGWAFMQSEMPGVSVDLLSSACEEGQVTIYQGTWTDAQIAQVEAFEKHFPCIEVERFEGLASQLRNRFLTESQAGNHVVDIVQDTDTLSLDEWISEGMLAEYTVANDDAYSDTAKHSGYWYALRYAMIGVAWNTDRVPAEDAKILAEWKGLTDPRWQNYRTGMTTGRSNFVLTPIYVWYRELGEEGVAKIGATAPQLFSSSSSAAASLASGDIDVLLTASETGLLPLWLAGAPIEWTMPSPGVGPISAQAISANAPHPNAARLYQEYSFTDEGARIWQELGGAPARQGAADGREVARESWYHVPDTIFSLTPENVDDLRTTAQRLVDTYIKK